jgi:hypothetical protein
VSTACRRRNTNGSRISTDQRRSLRLAAAERLRRELDSVVVRTRLQQLLATRTDTELLLPQIKDSAERLQYVAPHQEREPLGLHHGELEHEKLVAKDHRCLCADVALQGATVPETIRLALWELLDEVGEAGASATVLVV